MAIEKRPVRIIFLATLLLFLAVSLLPAQNEEIRFMQRLTWTGDEYARHYEVIIEREERGAYRELRREYTPEIFIEVSLAPGKYRCMVIPYNLVNMAGDASQWMYIEVLAALNPELDTTPPGFSISGSLYEMRVSGKNLIPGAEIFLRGSGGELVPAERIVPVEIQNGRNGTYVRLLFDKDQLVAGNYELVVINPGGLMTSRSGIVFPPATTAKFAAPKKADMFLSAAWMPSFTIADKENKGTLFFGQDRSFAGAVVRFGVTTASGTGSASYLNFNPGLELAGTYNFFDTDTDTSHLWGVGLNLLAMKWLGGDKMALTFRLGAGYSAFFQTTMGVSFLLCVIDNWYLETGIDYAHWFTDTDPYPGSFRPWLGVGFKK
jgi:hypothetical protein